MSSPNISLLLARTFDFIFGKEESKPATLDLTNAVLARFGLEPIGEIDAIDASTLATFESSATVAVFERPLKAPAPTAVARQGRPSASFTEAGAGGEGMSHSNREPSGNT